ncbi:MAG TPA: hypothetical protein VMS02_07465 [Solirubrobacteraceae bacterium]|nr:hypothetical protein [Solirubrobacteraceae bacterium]
MTVRAIERQIVARLAEREGREPRELERELRAAHRDLPVEPALLEELLPTLEEDFGVSLRRDSRLALRLCYAYDLALAFRQQLAIAQLVAEPARTDCVERRARTLGRAA